MPAVSQDEFIKAIFNLAVEAHVRDVLEHGTGASNELAKCFAPLNNAITEAERNTIAKLDRLTYAAPR